MHFTDLLQCRKSVPVLEASCKKLANLCVHLLNRYTHKLLCICLCSRVALNFLWLGCQGPDLSLCAFVWEAQDSRPGGSTEVFLSIFDMNRWYHAQMPARIKWAWPQWSLILLNTWREKSLREKCERCFYMGYSFVIHKVCLIQVILKGNVARFQMARFQMTCRFTLR